MRGLTSLTEPGDEDPVGAVVDVAVIGARGDGKTQFIVHAIRTLRAYAPLLTGKEHQYNRDVMQVVMSAKEPRPEATPPGIVPHYVFRIRPDSLLSQVGFGGRLSLYARVAGLWTYVLLALINAGALGALLVWFDGAFGLAAADLAPQLVPVAAAAGVGLIGLVVGVALSRRQFVRRGDIEIVFWDVAGEHVYSESAADYYSFLSALVRRRRERASPHRSYAFAPVLICNPLSLGMRIEGSPYSRLRQLLPMFASLNERLPRALVAINRWAVVQEVCAPDSNRDDKVAMVPRSRSTVDTDGDADGDTDGGPGSGDADLRGQLPIAMRDVVRKLCLDAEDGAGDDDDSDIFYSYLRYDAGIQCEFKEHKWTSWDAMPGAIKARWRAPARTEPDMVVEYIYEDGPGSFKGDVRRAFLNWLAGLAFHEASYRTFAVAEPGADHAWANSPRRKKPATARAGDPGARSTPKAAKPKELLPARAEAKESGPGEAEFRESEFGQAAPAADRRPRDPAGDDSDRNAWLPRALSAHGLEEFARNAIAPAVLDWTDEGAPSPDKPVLGQLADHGAGRPGNSASSDFAREGTEPGVGPESDEMPAQRPSRRLGTEPDGSGIESMQTAAPDPEAAHTQTRSEPSDTIPMPGGFGSGGT